MKRIQTQNPNSRVYWNHVYGGEEQRLKYEKESFGQSGGSKRFSTAVSYVKDGDKVLDIGCGVGLFTRMVKDAHPTAEVWGTDISNQAIEENRERHKDITYHAQYIGDQKKVPDNYFDLVFCGETIEHIDDPKLVFQDAARVIKKDGTLIVTTPLENHIGSSEHIWAFEYEDLEQLYQDHGFSKPNFVYLPNMEHFYVIFAVGKKL